MSAKKSGPAIDKVEQLNTMVFSASAEDLAKWLHQLPHPVAKGWNYHSVPLVRCATLDRPDLFKKWLDWGCSLSGNYHHTNRTSYSVGIPIINKIIEANPKALLWMLEHSPQTWMHHLSSLCREGYAGSLAQLDWRKIVNHPSCSMEDRQQLALLNVVSSNMFADPNMLLRASNGALGAPGVKLGYYWVVSASRTPTDDVLFSRINKIETGLLQSANINQLVELGYWWATTAVVDHLQLNNPSYFDIHPSRSIPSSWKDWAFKINSSSYTSLTEAQLINVWNTVSEYCLDVRTADREKSTILHALLDIRSWPMPVRQHAARHTWEKKNILIHQKNRSGKTVADAASGHSSASELATYIMSLESARHLDNVLAHQTNSVVSKNKKPEVEPVRKRRM